MGNAGFISSTVLLARLFLSIPAARTMETGRPVELLGDLWIPRSSPKNQRWQLRVLNPKPPLTPKSRGLGSGLESRVERFQGFVWLSIGRAVVLQSYSPQL